MTGRRDVTGEDAPLTATKFSMPMRVSADDLAWADEMREHECRLAAMTPQERAERRARQDAERAAAYAEALADWQAVYDRLAGNAPALAALGIHRPMGTANWLSCAHCREGDSDPVEWPCETFTAIKGA
jgi:hypothetical protein